MFFNLFRDSRRFNSLGTITRAETCQLLLNALKAKKVVLSDLGEKTQEEKVQDELQREEITKLLLNDFVDKYGVGSFTTNLNGKNIYGNVFDDGCFVQLNMQINNAYYAYQYSNDVSDGGFEKNMLQGLAQVFGFKIETIDNVSAVLTYKYNNKTYYVKANNGAEGYDENQINKMIFFVLTKNSKISKAVDLNVNNANATDYVKKLQGKVGKGDFLLELNGNKFYGTNYGDFLQIEINGYTYQMGISENEHNVIHKREVEANAKELDLEVEKMDDRKYVVSFKKNGIVYFVELTVPERYFDTGLEEEDYVNGLLSSGSFDNIVCCKLYEDAKYTKAVNLSINDEKAPDYVKKLQGKVGKGDFLLELNGNKFYGTNYGNFFELEIEGYNYQMGISENELGVVYKREVERNAEELGLEVEEIDSKKYIVSFKKNGVVYFVKLTAPDRYFDAGLEEEDYVNGLLYMGSFDNIECCKLYEDAKCTKAVNLSINDDKAPDYVKKLSDKIGKGDFLLELNGNKFYGTNYGDFFELEIEGYNYQMGISENELGVTYKSDVERNAKELDLEVEKMDDRKYVVSFKKNGIVYFVKLAAPERYFDTGLDEKAYVDGLLYIGSLNNIECCKLYEDAKIAK